MEIYTCEAYVLAQLGEAMRRNEELANEVDSLKARNTILKAQDSPFMQKLREVGAKALFERVTSVSTPERDGELLDFEAWRDRVTYSFNLPDGFTRQELFDGLDKEYREAYDAYVASRGKGADAE